MLLPDASVAVLPAEMPVPADVAISAESVNPESDVADLKISSPGT
jgi:hypothetical protein